MKNILEKIILKPICIIIIFSCITNFLIFPVLFGNTAVGIYKDYYDRWIGRKPHITGQIKLTIYGKPISLSDKNIRLTYRNDRDEQNIEFIGGRFKRNYGGYGENIFRLYLSESFCRQNINKSFKNDLVVEFGYFTAPNWYKDNTDLNIIIEKSKIDKNSDIIKIIQNVSGDDRGRKEEIYNLKYPLNNQQVLKVHQTFI